MTRLVGKKSALDELPVLRRYVTWIAGCVATAAALAIPTLYFFTAHSYESARVEEATRAITAELSEMAYTNPTMWQYDNHRLEALARSERYGYTGRSHQLIDENGRVLAEWGDKPTGPTVSRIGDIFSYGDVVGHVRITESLQPVLVATGWVALIAVGLAVGVFVVLRLIPLRALRNALGDLEHSQFLLRERVEELEKTRRKLEMQSESLTRLADDLRFARDEARAANRAKSEFLANMSHELRTPLNAVIGFSEIIKDETFGPVGSVQYRDYAGDIHESGRHLLSLINDILDLSKVELGTDELHEERIEVPEIIRSSLKLVWHRAEQGGIKLGFELSDELPALCVDERKLKQILVNLLSNAVKFTDAGGEVMLRAWCRMDSGHVFQIVDTGIGIASEDISKALSHFGQVDGDLNRQYEGTGLGLPLTKALVELHGGALDLQSEVGVGTTVTVCFPAERIVASLDNSGSLDLEDRAAS